MKKILLSIALAGLVLAPKANAQVIWSQDFNSATIGSLPASWTQTGTATPPAGGWKVANWAAPTTTGWASATGVTSPAHATQIALLDDWNDSGTTAAPISHLNARLESPVFSLSGSTSAWLNYEYYYFNATRSATSATEEAYVWGSTDGGSTWVPLDTLEGWAFNGTWHTGHTSLAPLGTGTNVKIAFSYSDDNDHLLGLALDNVEVINLTASSAKVTALGYNSINNGISANGQSLSFLLENSGVPITSFTAKYTINGGTPVTQNFTSVSVPAYSSQAFTFTTAMSGAIAGLNTVNVVITDVNSVANTDVDSARSSTFTLASATSNRWGLIEEFTSSTCPPCRAFNNIYDPLCTSYGVNTSASRVSTVKYQMNWPSPGTDRSYNNDGSIRRTYYGVSGIPDRFVNGLPATAPSTTTALTAELDASKANPSFIDMSVNYTVDTVGRKIGVVLKVTPRFTKTGNYKVHVAVMDKYYENTTNTTTQLQYHHVMRRMLPSASGRTVTSWTDGVEQTFVDTALTYTAGNWTAGVSSYPTQGSNMFWANPYTNSEVVAWVQDESNGTIMQSIWSLPAGLMSTVSTMATVDNIKLYPNPTTEVANLQFSLQEAGNVSVRLMEYTGKVVSEVVNGNMNAGVQNVTINTKNVAPGNYVVLISTEKGSTVERLTVEK